MRGSRISRTMTLALPRSETSARAAASGLIGAGPSASDRRPSAAPTSSARPEDEEAVHRGRLVATLRTSAFFGEADPAHRQKMRQSEEESRFHASGSGSSRRIRRD